MMEIEVYEEWKEITLKCSSILGNTESEGTRCPSPLVTRAGLNRYSLVSQHMSRAFCPATNNEPKQRDLGHQNGFHEIFHSDLPSIDNSHLI